MPDQPSPPKPQELWQSQTEEETNLTLVDIHNKAEQFQTNIRRRNLREAISIIASTVIYCGFLWFLPGALTKLGAALTLAGMYFSFYQLYRDGSAREVPADAPAGDCVEFHRRELRRQRDLLRRVGPWQIGPILPGVVVFFAGVWQANVRDSEDAWIMGLSGALSLGVLGFVYWLNVRAANKLDEQLRALDD